MPSSPMPMSGRSTVDRSECQLHYGGEMIDRGVTVMLNADQAIVLSDWLDRVIGTERFDSFIDEDAAVWSPLYQLHGALETTLPEIFAADYSDRLDAARRRLLPTLTGRRHPPSRRAAVDAAGSMTASPTLRPPPGAATTRHVSGWIREDRVAELLGWVAGYIGYTYDQFDEQALVGALDPTDDEARGLVRVPAARLARPHRTTGPLTRVRGRDDADIRTPGRHPRRPYRHPARRVRQRVLAIQSADDWARRFDACS